MALKLNFNGTEVDQVSTPFISELFNRFSNLFSREKLVYLLEDCGRKGPSCTYRSVLLGYDLEDVIRVLDLQKLEKEIEDLVTFLSENLDAGYGSWDPEEVRVFSKTFGYEESKDYLWIKLGCYYTE